MIWSSDVPNPAPHVVWAAVVLTSMSHLSQVPALGSLDGSIVEVIGPVELAAGDMPALLVASENTYHQPVRPPCGTTTPVVPSSKSEMVVAAAGQPEGRLPSPPPVPVPLPPVPVPLPPVPVPLPPVPVPLPPVPVPLPPVPVPLPPVPVPVPPVPVVPPVLPPPTQAPLLQFLPPLQTVPQLPQLLLSAAVLTQVEPHSF